MVQRVEKRMKHDITFGVLDQRPQNDDNFLVSVWPFATANALLYRNSESALDSVIITVLLWCYRTYIFKDSSETKPPKSLHLITLMSSVNIKKLVWAEEAGKKKRNRYPCMRDLKQTWIPYTVISHPSRECKHTYEHGATTNPVPRRHFPYTSFDSIFMTSLPLQKSSLILILDTGPMH